MSVTPTRETERLVLRPFTEHDVDAVFALLRDPEVNTFLPMFPLRTREEAERYLREVFLRGPDLAEIRYAICLRPDDTPIGYVKISGDDSHDLGYALRREYWHCGIVTEACRAILEEARRRKLPYVTATHDVHNPRSGAVMKKIGMTYCYSYEEQWQPKDFPVIFRMYQLNLDGEEGRVYREYWNRYPRHFVESL